MKRKASNGFGSSMSKRRKPTAKDRTGFRNRVTNFVASRGPIAPRTVVKLKYHEDYLTPGVIVDQRFNLNSIYDPNLTGTGHQPLGHDQYATFYNRYRVYKVSYVVGIACLGANENYKVSIGASNSTVSFTDPSVAAESPTFKTQLVSNASPIIMKGSYYLPSINGSTSAVYKADDRFAALFGSSPTEQIVMHIVTSSVGNDAVPTSGKLGFTVNLVYHCELFDPKDLAQS